MEYDEMLSRVAESTGLGKGFIDKVYKGYWRAVREHITTLPLKEDLTDEQFLALKTSVNIPSIGKLHVSLSRYRKLKSYHDKVAKKTENQD